MRVLFLFVLVLLSLSSIVAQSVTETTAAPTNCPSPVATAECVCSHKNQFWAIGGFFDECNSCECKADGSVFCTLKACPIIPNSNATVDTCLITNEDFSSCEGGITPCAAVLCGSGSSCVAHKCGTFGECAATCTCDDDSKCSNGDICQANEFGIKVCTEDPNKVCPNGEPQVRCFAQPCAVAVGKCKKGNDFCVDDYCGGCNAKCQCDSDSDCERNEACQADWKGINYCTARPTCEYNGKIFEAGSTFPSNDGCNDCFCSENGVVGCTKKACSCDKGFFSCKRDPCSTKTCKSDICINDSCGGCKAKCQCNKNSDCASTETCQKDSRSQWSYCGPRPRPTTTPRPKTTTTRRPTRSTTTTTRRPTKTTTTTTTIPATTECPGKVCPAILCANRPVACKYQCGIDYCSCTDFCKCRNTLDCASNERCEGAGYGVEGKCVKTRGLLSQLGRM